MKVQELIEKLGRFPKNTEVIIKSGDNDSMSEFEKIRIAREIKVVFSEKCALQFGRPVWKGHELGDPDYVQSPDDERLGEECILLDF